MKVVFAASPAIACPSLEVLVKSVPCVDLVAIVTKPDSLKGRGAKKAEPSEVSVFASGLVPEVPQLKPEKLDSDFINIISNLAPDLLVSFAYGKIFPVDFLKIFPKGGINVHPSLLPKYRGASPIASAILSGERVSGLSVQAVEKEADTGAIYASQTISIGERETTASLTAAFARLAAQMLPDVLEGIEANSLRPQAQSTEGVSYCSLIKKEDGRINWEADAVEIDRRIRAFTPWPLCFTQWGGRALFILEAHPVDVVSTEKAGTVLSMDKKEGVVIKCGDGGTDAALAVTRLQAATKKALDFRAFMNGAAGFVGTQLG
jgi:methionyl-tRNA formyltransferase